MAKIFIGIALVVTLLTAYLGFATKSKVDSIQGEKKDAVTAKNKAEGERQVAKTELKKAQDDLAVAKTAVDEKEKEVAAKTALVDGLQKQIADAKTAADEAAKVIADLTEKAKTNKPDAPVGPDPAVAAAEAAKQKAEAELAESKQIQETLNRKLKDNESRMAALELYKRDRENIVQRPGVRGRVLAVNPGWNFVVLSVGDKQGLMTDSPMLVMRDGEPIAKVRVTSIQNSRSIADVIPGSVRQGATVQPGDQVVVEGNRTQPIKVPDRTEPAPAAAPAVTAPAN